MVWREKERSKISYVVQMDNLKGLFGMKRIDRMPNAQVREMCGVTKEADESVCPPFSHTERMESSRIPK